MAWIHFLLALAAFAAALATTSIALMVACLLAALGLLVAWAMQLHARRVAARRADPPAADGAGPGPAT